MIQAYLGTIILVGFTWAPEGWALCDGTLLPIQQNQAVYAVLGTTYGGDGQTNFALPDLRGKTPGGIGTFLICVQGTFPSRQ